MFTAMKRFTPFQIRLDILLGICFLLLAVFSSVRILRSFGPTLGRKVITTFNVMIFCASTSRAIWFLLPNSYLESSYVPQPVIAFHTPRWQGTLISEFIEVFGSVTLYGVFILVACYWTHMLIKLNTAESQQSLVLNSGRIKFGTLCLFSSVMLGIVILEAINIGLFLIQRFNSEQMILYDSIFLSVLSVAVVIAMTTLSHHIKVILSNLEIINQRSSQPQIRRIFAIILAANVFFTLRVVLELTLSISLVVLFRSE